MVTSIRIYVEGGGDSNETKTRLQQGFNTFFQSIREQERQRKVRWNVITCGGREQTFDMFERALITHPESFNVLLVDAEGPVSDAPWQHLQQRDGWKQPNGTTDDQCHLMIQAMEAWIVADRAALQRYYGQGFNPKALPKNPRVETHEPDALENALKEAAKHTKKKTYHKIHHGPELLQQLNSATVRAVAPACDRLFTTLLGLIGG